MKTWLLIKPSLFLFFRRVFLVVAVFTILRLIFYFSNYQFFPDYQVGLLSKAFLVGILSDLQSIAIFFSPFILLQLMPFRWQKLPVFRVSSIAIYLLIAAAIILFSLVETAYFPFSFQRMHAGSFRLTGDTPILYFLGRFWHLFIFFIALSALVVIFCRPNARTSPETGFRGYVMWLLMILCCWLLAFSSGRKRPIMPSDLSLLLPANAAILATNTPQHILFTWYLNKYRNRNMLEKKAYMSTAAAEQRYSIFHYPDSNSTFKDYNVVIFVLESFSRSYLEAGNPNKAFTPFLDSLSKESLVCTNAFANASISLGGLTAIMGGIPPIAAASHMESPYSQNFMEPFFLQLQKKGYSNAFFYGGEDDHFGFRRLAGQLGFDQYYSGEDVKDKGVHDGVWGIYDGPFFAFAESKLSATPSPFAAVIFNLSSHYPYRIPDEYADILPRGHLNSHQSITYVDLSLRQFFGAAKNKAWYSNTIFVIVADHWSKEDDSQKGEGPFRYTIPLMIYLPDGRLKGKYEQVADQLGIIPTLADIMGFPDPFMSFGRSIFRDKPGYSYGLLEFPHLFHVISDRFTLQYDEKHERVSGLYAYKEKDGMKYDLADSLPVVRKKLEQQLKAFIQVHHNSMLENKLIPPNP